MIDEELALLGHLEKSAKRGLINFRLQEYANCFIQSLKRVICLPLLVTQPVFLALTAVAIQHQSVQNAQIPVRVSQCR
ncbi:hypothetical protein NIES2098_15790 [Calothrix sp. NIES-2098]|nr:hypothetical protein NIES2098_15790 [Calothrix sp. NIES-2098]